MTSALAPANAELEILHLLWKDGPLTVRDIHTVIGKRRDIRYTTVLKTLQVMAEKGFVTRDESERSHVYAAALPESAVKKRLVSEMVDRVFDGSAANLVMQALSTRKATTAELNEIRRLLDTMKRGED